VPVPFETDPLLPAPLLEAVPEVVLVPPSSPDSTSVVSPPQLTVATRATMGAASKQASLCADPSGTAMGTIETILH
jgi:hypothetical protein